MGSQPPLRWLGLAALADWWITRTLSRAGIFIPKTPALISAYQTLTTIGQVATALAGLLALAGLAWIVREEWRRRPAGLNAGLLAVAGVLSVVFVFVPPARGRLLLAHLAFLGSIGVLGKRLIRQRPWLAVPVGAYLLARAYHLLPAVYEVADLPGPPPLSTELFRLGELLVVATGVAIWSYWGRAASRRAWLGAAVPTVAFSGMVLSAPSMVGILSIWSTGLTLYLPWPVYALGLWLAAATVVHSFQAGDSRVGWAILLMAAGGYAPQLSTQILFGLIALWLLGEAGEPAATSARRNRGRGAHRLPVREPVHG